MSGKVGNWSLYPYDPVKPLPILFAVLVTFLAFFHCYQTFIKYKWPRFGITMLLASSVWIAGFVCRAVSVHNVQNIPVFIAQYVMILMGPPLFAAAETFILGCLFAYLPYHAPMHPQRVFSTFALLSAAVEALTASGASNSAGNTKDPARRATGLNLVKSALILQAVLEAAFFSLVVLLHSRCKRSGHFVHNVRVMCYVLYVTSAMMMVRCVVRAVEGFEAAGCAPGQGYCGAVETQEWFLWVFEVANITVFIAALAVFTPGKYLPRENKQYLDPKDARTERVGPGFSKADSRPFLTTIVDPFNIVGILTGRGMVMDKFWEREHPVASVSYAGKGIAAQRDEMKLHDDI